MKWTKSNTYLREKKADEKKGGVLHTLISKPKSLTKDISRKMKREKKYKKRFLQFIRKQGKIFWQVISPAVTYKLELSFFLFSVISEFTSG